MWAIVSLPFDRTRTTARAIATTSYEQLAIVDVPLQEIGLLLHSGRAPR